MSIRNVLVAFDGTDRSKNALRLAIQVATAKDAHLTGLFVQLSPVYYANIGAWLPDNTIAMLAERDAQHAAEVKATFERLCQEQGMTARTSFELSSGQPNTRFVEFGRTYDLIVIGQPETDSWDDRNQPYPDTVALQSGRPVMIAPRNFTGLRLDGGTVVAWDGKRAAARALSDSFDLIDGTGPLVVQTVDRQENEIRQPGRDIMEHLSRHGIAAELRVTPKNGRSIGSILLETCQTQGAGMLVMGAYEHSQFSEELIGGVTKEVLAKTKLPVLMSH
ncbi:MAG: universal stress protein [Pseudomonadota bacterium]